MKRVAAARQAGMSLHTATGACKYLTAGERDPFLCPADRADRADRPIRPLCMTLAYAGCSLSEALAHTADRVDASGVPAIAVGVDTLRDTILPMDRGSQEAPLPHQEPARRKAKPTFAAAKTDHRGR